MISDPTFLIKIFFEPSKDFFEPDFVTPDTMFENLIESYDIVLLVRSVTLSSIFFAVAKSLFSMSLDLLLDRKTGKCFALILGIVGII